MDHSSLSHTLEQTIDKIVKQHTKDTEPALGQNAIMRPLRGPDPLLPQSGEPRVKPSVLPLCCASRMLPQPDGKIVLLPVAKRCAGIDKLRNLLQRPLG
jgi:hypothetical protein